MMCAKSVHDIFLFNKRSNKMEYHAKSRHWNCVCSSGKESAGDVKYFLQTNFSSPEYSFKITLAKHSYVWYTISDIIPLGAEQKWGDDRRSQLIFRGNRGLSVTWTASSATAAGFRSAFRNFSNDSMTGEILPLF